MSARACELTEIILRYSDTSEVHIKAEELRKIEQAQEAISMLEHAKRIYVDLEPLFKKKGKDP